jgi:UDP-2-acetamido-3-amino-2,3-dideoxy-glucuronate N-acetyltransferase
MSGFFQHSHAVVEPGATIGKGTRIWAFAHIVKGAVLGADCNICDHTFIEGQVRIGNRATIKSGVFLWDGLVLEDDVFIGPAAVFTNDYRPRSRKQLKDIAQTILKEGCTVGANSTTLPGLTIGKWAMIGAGAVVTRSVPDFALVRGNPARVVGWVCRCGEKLVPSPDARLICKCGYLYKQISEYRIEGVPMQTKRKPGKGRGKRQN